MTAATTPYDNGLAYSRKDIKYRKGVKALADWHAQCRRKRIEKAIAERKRQDSLKRIAAAVAKYAKD